MTSSLGEMDDAGDLYRMPGQQLAKADIQIADHNVVPSGKGRKAKCFVEHCRHTATVSMPRRTFRFRTKPDAGYQVAF